MTETMTEKHHVDITSFSDRFSHHSAGKACLPTQALSSAATAGHPSRAIANIGCTLPPCVQVCDEARIAIASALPPELVGSASVMAPDET